MKSFFKRIYWKLSFAKKISLFNIGMIFLILVSFILILRYYFEKNALEIVSNAYVQKFDMVSDNCADILLGAERITKVLSTDEDVESWFLDLEEPGSAERLRQKMNVENRLDYLEALYSENQFSSISIYTTDGEMVNTNEIRKEADIYQKLFDKIKKISAKPQWIDLYGQERHEGYEEGIAYVRPYREYSSGEIAGYILVKFDSDLLSKTFLPLKYEKEGQYIISDSEGNIKIISVDDKDKTNIVDQDFFSWIKEENQEGKTFQIDGEKYLITSAKIDTLGWFMIGVTPVNILTEEGEFMTLILYVVGFFAIVVAAMLSYFAAHTVTKPVSELADTMKQFGKGELNVSVAVRSSDEIGVLSATFNNMTKQIRDLVNKVYQVENDKRKYEFAVLQAQINPHFLYNTLSSVSALIKVQRSEDAFKMIHSIGQFYRTSLSSGRNLIPIRTEVENIKNYIEIQKMRYGDKIRYDISFDEDIMDIPIVKLTLQPIVENAIYHGVKNVSYQGEITIRGSREKEDVLIRVKDNGVGMDETTASQLLNAHMNQDKTSFGLYNVNQRLELYFMKPYGISVFTKPGEGTEIFVRIPGVTKEERDEESTDC